MKITSKDLFAKASFILDKNGIHGRVAKCKQFLIENIDVCLRFHKNHVDDPSDFWRNESNVEFWRLNGC